MTRLLEFAAVYARRALLAALIFGQAPAIAVTPPPGNFGPLHVPKGDPGSSSPLRDTLRLFQPYEQFGYAVAISGDTLLIGAPEGSDGVRGEGAAYVYIRVGDAWRIQAKLSHPDGIVWDRFGEAVALQGDTALVGAPRGIADEGQPGSVFVFVREGTTWTRQQEITASDGEQYASFGSSISLSGDTALIGARFDSGAGAAYVFVRDADGWQPQQKLSVPGLTPAARFGNAVALEGDIALIGAPDDGTLPDHRGSVYAYVRDGSDWGEPTRLSAQAQPAFSTFGASIALSGNRALIGGYNPNLPTALPNSRAYVYERIAGVWTQEAVLAAADGSQFDGYGSSVAISDDIALVGAYLSDPRGGNSGALYVYRRDGDAWAQHSRIVPLDARSDDQFGASVAFDGQTAISGAIASTASATRDLARTFEWDGTSFTEHSTLDVPLDAQMGSAVAFWGDTALLGAPNEHVGGLSQGAVYVFHRSSFFGWRVDYRLIAQDGQAGDRFGSAVALRGDTAVVGAPGASRVAPGHGAAYVFEHEDGLWTQTSSLASPDLTHVGFGRSVAVSEDTAAVAAWGMEPAVYLFARGEAGWTQQHAIAEFSSSIALDGNRALVGTTAGALLMERNGSAWSVANVFPLPTSESSSTVALDGDVALVESRDVAHAFRHDGGAWIADGTLVTPPGAYTDTAIALSGNVALVGKRADETTNQRGAVFPFVRNDGRWIRQAALLSDGFSPFDGFASSVAMHGETAVVGAPADDRVAVDRGIGYLFPPISFFEDSFEDRGE